MALYKRRDVTQKMGETGLVPLFYSPDIDTAKAVIKACYQGGARAFEFTNRGDNAHEIFSEITKWVSKQYPDMVVGIGSIVDPGTTSLYIQSGANFIVSPVLNPEMAKVCNRRKVLWIPGCATLSEISLAEEFGAEIVKIFPGATVGGPNFIKSIKGPCPWSDLMPSGGVSPTKANLTEWFTAGAFCVGMGSKLITKNEEGNYDYSRITKLTQTSIQIISDLKKEH